MTNSKKLINSPETAVVDALEGLVLTYGHLQRLEGWPHIKVVINRHHDKSKVAVISGGGAGHEPAHAGYVGEGMLAAAVSGEVFASPPAEAVLAAIRAVTGPAGALLVVKNYTGDRLCFGLAAERALSEGYAIEVVQVGEDVAVEAPAAATGRRGLAGTVLVHKAAGAAAAAGLPLRDVAAVAARVAGRMGTLGVGLAGCTLPGKQAADRLGPDEVELGLGIHGEPGQAKLSPLPPAEQLIARMVRQLTHGSFMRLAGAKGASEGEVGGRRDPRVVLLVNNLGATPPLELAIATREALRAVRRDASATVDRLFVGPYMTSLDMAGVSLTLLSYDLDQQQQPPSSQPLSEQQQQQQLYSWEYLLELLDAPTNAPGWLHGGSSRGPAVPSPYDSHSLRDIPAPLPPAPAPPKHEQQQQQQLPPAPASPASTQPSQPASAAPAAGAVLGGVLRAVAGALLGAAGQLNELDAKVGDGDCGTTHAAAASALLAALEGRAGGLKLSLPAVAAGQLCQLVRSAVGGSSGALYDILLTAAARRLQTAAPGPAPPSPGDWAEALSAGLAAVQRYGRAGLGCRTMLDALLPARDALREALEAGADAATAAAAAAAAASAGAAATAQMTSAAAGRASYLPAEALEGVEDPGARAAAVWVGAVAQALQRG